MDQTVRLTSAEMEALISAYPGLTAAEAAEALLRHEMQRRYRTEFKRGLVVRLQALKRAR